MFFTRTTPIKWLEYINPDGSKGGRVAETAVVGRNVFIKRTARVLPDAVVPDDAVVELGVMYTPDGPVKFS